MFRSLREDGRPLVMGILNVTPDSFSDGGQFVELRSACAAAERMVAEGADIIDIGGESTRPGAAAVDVATQMARVLPVVTALRQTLPAQIALSVDTRSAEVARAVLQAGALIINDVSAGGDAAMLATIAEFGGAVVLMHMQGTPQTMQQAPHYTDVATEVRDYLLARAALAEAAGITRERIALDPGIGFGKTRVHNLTLLGALNTLAASGYAVLLGTSRKRFMGAICSETDPLKLLGATCATTALGVAAGVQVVRVHDVKANRQAADVAWAIAAQQRDRRR